MKRLLITIIFSHLFACSIAQSASKEVVAKDGDGIYAILRDNGYDPGIYLSEFIQLNKDNLTKDNGLYIGRSYVLPEKRTVEKKQVTQEILIVPRNKLLKAPVKEDLNKMIFPIFGKQYEKVTIEDKQLKGAVYYLVAGHGGPDPGATVNYKGKLIAEDEYAYDVTLRLARFLLSRGATVYIIIRDSKNGIRDEEVLEVDYNEVNYPDEKIPQSQKLRLRQRVNTINELYIKNKGAYQRLLVIHIDSRSKGENIDVFFYHHKKSKSGTQLAKDIHETFKKKYAQYQPNRLYSGTILTRNLYMVKYTYPPMVYIELGNIRNKKDQKRILQYDNRQAVAKWIYLGLLENYKNR